MDRHFGSAQHITALKACLFKVNISDFITLFWGYFSHQFPNFCSGILLQTHTTCSASLLVSLVTFCFQSCHVLLCHWAWILKISVLAGGSFWDCIEVLGAKQVESVSCWWIIEHPLVVRSQIKEVDGVWCFGGHLILEQRCIIKSIQRLKSQSVHGSGNGSTRLAFAIFIHPSNLHILFCQVIISYIVFFPQYFTCFGKILKVTEATKCYWQLW